MSVSGRASHLLGFTLITGLAVGLVLIWIFDSSVAAADEAALRIILHTPETCEVDADSGPISPTLEIGWEVSGGVPPYQIHVHGQHQTEPLGRALALCGIWERQRVSAGQMPILGRVTDADGASASALAFTQAVQVIRVDPSPHDRLIALQPGQTYLIHGVMATTPADAGFGLGPYMTHDCKPGAAECGDEFPLYFGENTWGSVLWLRRWHHDESKRFIAEGEDAERVNAIFDQVVASIGQAPETPLLQAGLLATDSSQLDIELRAPAICETYWGRYGGARQTIQVEWQVRGGTAPYQVQFADRRLEGDAGTISVPCGVQRDDADGVDSQLMNTQAIVADANGAVSSAVVSTYVIAANRFGGSELLGGWTHRVQGLLMTIPDGLTFNVETFGHALVDCEPEEAEDEAQASSPGTSADWSIRDHSYLYRCQNRWSMHGEWRIGDLSGTMWVGFGETTDDVVGRGANLDDSSADEPGAEQALAEVERRIDEVLAASVGQSPTLPDIGRYNPAPLSIRAWPEPLVCGPLDSWSQLRLATAQRRVAGGYWWPLGVGDEAWNADLYSARVNCDPGWGTYSNTLETHESGPNPAKAETVVTHLVVPMIGDHDALYIQPGNWPTSYCEPGGPRTISWTVQLGTPPYQARVNGVAVEINHNEELDYGSGWHEVTCADRLGLQAMTVEVWDSAESPNRVTFPILLMAVHQHPSGQPWSDFARDD